MYTCLQWLFRTNQRSKRIEKIYDHLLLNNKQIEINLKNESLSARHNQAAFSFLFVNISILVGDIIPGYISF